MGRDSLGGLIVTETIDPKRLYSVRAAAELIPSTHQSAKRSSITTRTLRAWIAAGKVRVVKRSIANGRGQVFITGEEILNLRGAGSSPPPIETPRERRRRLANAEMRCDKHFKGGAGSGDRR